MTSMKTSARRSGRHRAAAAVVLAVIAAGASACGNRLSNDRLSAAAGRENNGGNTAASQPAAGGGSPETKGSTGMTDAQSAVAGVTGAATGPAASAASPAGNSGPPVVAARAGSGAATSPKPGSAAVSGGSAGGAAKRSASPGSAATPNGESGATKSVPGTGGGAPGGGPSAPGSSGACNGTKAPIVIGSVGEYSGLLGPILAPGTKSVQAWVAATNAKGGLNCHSVKYVVYDTGGDPARDQSLTQRAVEQDKVIAFVYNGAALSGQASADYLRQHRIPVIGEEGAQPWICYSPMGFSVMSSCNEGIQGIYQTLAKVIKPGDQVAAITCNEVPYCTGYHNNAEKYATEAGLKLVYNGSISMTQPDYTSACVQAKNAGAKSLVLGMEGTSASRLRRSCRSVSFDVPIISIGTAFSASVGDTSMEGAWITSGVRITPPDHPAVAEWLAALKQYVPGTTPVATGGIGWVAAKVFELAAKHFPDMPTNEAVLDGLWSIKGNDIGGLTRPLTYNKDQPAPQTPACWFVNQLAKEGWIGDTRICL